MKKYIVLTMLAVLMASCSEQQMFDEYLSEVAVPQTAQETSQASILNSYLEKARWGDGSAFLKLAECYHDGIGVKPDFMGTLTMLMMADQYGVANHSVEDYLMSLPDTDHTKMMFEAFARVDKNNVVLSDSIIEALISNGCSDGYAIKGVVQVERGDTLSGQQSIKAGAELGSSFSELLLCAFPSPETDNGKYLNLDMLKNLASHSPVANKLLGDVYAGYSYGKESDIDESLAAFYYKKADEQGCLGKRPARWLINYYDRNGIKIDTLELERLQVLSGHMDEPDELIPDSVCVEPDCLEVDSIEISE